jgi:NAD(P)-dependent dehydrogenase (short-subunit alcohol dehydrogenase family)
MDLGLRGKVALVTGASKGLGRAGRAIAKELAKEGAHVSICARGRQDLAKAAAALRQHGARVIATQADVTVKTGRSVHRAYRRRSNPPVRAGEAHRLFLEIGAPIRAEQVAKELAG